MRERRMKSTAPRGQQSSEGTQIHAIKNERMIMQKLGLSSF